MPFFLSPLWLLGLGALAVPIAIHFISRGRAPVMRVGSVRWIGGGETQSARRLRPTRLWLLALRVLLLALVVLALAGPRLPAPAAGEPTVVLVAEEIVQRRPQLEPGNRDLYSRLDAAFEAGGVEVVALAAAPAGGVWSRLREVALELPDAAAIEIYAPERLELLVGRRPALSQEVVWHAPRDPATSRWIENRAGGRLVGRSSRQRTLFERQPTATPPPARRAGARFVIRHGAEREVDAGYVRAALMAIAPHLATPVEIEMELVEESPGEADAPALLFELSGEPLSAVAERRARSGATLVTDAGERWESCAGRASIAGEPAAAGLALSRCSAPAAGAGEEALTLWWRADGVPLLTAEPLGAGRRYRFHSRFVPAWSNLVLEPFFIDWLLQLAQTAVGGDERRPDLRAAAPEQGQPRRAATLAAAPLREREDGVVELWLWGAAALLLAVERWAAVGRR